MALDPQCCFCFVFYLKSIHSVMFQQQIYQWLECMSFKSYWPSFSIMYAWLCASQISSAMKWQFPWYTMNHTCPSLWVKKTQTSLILRDYQKVVRDHSHVKREVALLFFCLRASLQLILDRISWQNTVRRPLLWLGPSVGVVWEKPDSQEPVMWSGW